MPNRIDSTRLAAHSWLAHVEYRPSVASTNDVAIELAADLSAPPSLSAHGPTLVVADQQTAGRGRGSNQWWSSEGALTFSVLTTLERLGLDAARLPRVSLATALAVTDALFESSPDSDWRIKWPNDVLLGRRKICGILIEVPNPVIPNPVARDIRPVVIGVGLNINNRRADAPDILCDTVTSLADATNSVHDLTDVLLRVLTALEDRFQQLASEDPQLVNDWQARCALCGATIEIEQGTKRIHGQCEGIDVEGRLIVAGETRTERVSSGVVISFT